MKRQQTCRENVWAAAINIEKHWKASLHSIYMDAVLKLGYCNLSLFNSSVCVYMKTKKHEWIDELFTLGGSKASKSESETLWNFCLMLRLSFFLSAPDNLWWDFASTAFLNILSLTSLLSSVHQRTR